MEMVLKGKNENVFEEVMKYTNSNGVDRIFEVEFGGNLPLNEKIIKPTVNHLKKLGYLVSGPYPADTLDIPITSVSTFVLLMSSLGIVLALHYLKESKMALAKLWLILVIVMGLSLIHI